MPVIIPLNDAGNREITVNTLGGGVYRFRSYFSQGYAGLYDGWFFDVSNTSGNALLKGVRITPGCPNLLKGQGDNFQDIQLACAVISGVETSPSALGNGTYLAWFNAGETNPFDVGDPLIDIPYDEWAFGEGTRSKFFADDGRSSIRVTGKISESATDALFALDDSGSMRVRPVVSAGTGNDYMSIDANGSIRMKG